MHNAAGEGEVDGDVDGGEADGVACDDVAGEDGREVGGHDVWAGRPGSASGVCVRLWAEGVVRGPRDARRD